MNNAGVAYTSRIEWGKFQDHFSHLFDVNTFGLVKVTRTFLPLIRQSRGRVINVSSVAGWLTCPYLCAYSMTKHAITAFTDSLRREMNIFGVSVSGIEPFFFKTPMVDELTGSFVSQLWQATPETVREAYGEDTLNHFLGLLTNQLPANEDVGQVAQAILAGLVDYQPKIVYSVIPRFFEKIFLNFLNMLPMQVQDYQWKIFFNYLFCIFVNLISN